jgi:hypothetical protein
MTAAFEMTLETLRLNRPYYLSEVGRGSLSLFNSTGCEHQAKRATVGRVMVPLSLAKTLSNRWRRSWRLSRWAWTATDVFRDRVHGRSPDCCSTGKTVIAFR